MSGLNILNILKSIQDPNKTPSSGENDSDSVSKQQEKKHVPYTKTQDIYQIFKDLDQVHIPASELDLDYKPKGFEHSYSIRDAYQCKKGALSNSLLINFMRENIPGSEFFALDAAQYQESNNRRTNNNGRNAKNKKPQGKRKGGEYQNANAGGNTNRRNNGHKNHIEDKPESSLEDTFEMMKIEKEIASTGNKMQDFELFKQMMRGENPNGSGPSADEQGPPGLSGMFATSNMDEDTFQELEPEGEEQSDNEIIEEPSTKKASKYASFFTEDEPEEEIKPVVKESNNSSRSKMLDFLRVQEEKSKGNRVDINVNISTGSPNMFNQQQVPKNGMPQQQHMPQHGLTQHQRGTPQPQHGMPQLQHGMPQPQHIPQHGMPQHQHGMPQHQHGMPQHQHGVPPQQHGMSQQQMMMSHGPPMNFPHGAQHPGMNPYMFGAPMGMPPQQHGAQRHQMPNMQQMPPQHGHMPNMQQMPPQHGHMPNMQQMHPGFMPGMPYGNMPNNGENRNAQQKHVPLFMEPNFQMLTPDQQMRAMQQFHQSMQKR